MSFTDLMQSGRGPGVIGMLLGMLVLLGFAVLFMFAFDEGLQGGQTLDSVVRQQTTDISRLRSDITRVKGSLEVVSSRASTEKSLEELERENKFRSAQLTTLENDLKNSLGKLEDLQNAFEDYKNQYRTFARNRAKGESIPRLETRDGEVYLGVTLRDVTAIGIQILHEGGQKRIHFEQLPAEMQERFQFDASQKAAAIANEEQIHKSHEAAVAASAAAVDAEAQNQRIKAAEEADQRRKLAIINGKKRIESMKEEIRNLREDIVREGHKTISRAPQMRAKLAAMERDYATLVREVAKLEASQP